MKKTNAPARIGLNYIRNGVWEGTKMKKKAKKAKTTGKAWKPEVGETYYVPYLALGGRAEYEHFPWEGDETDSAYYRTGLVCLTKAQAIRKARAMLRAAKETQ